MLMAIENAMLKKLRRVGRREERARASVLARQAIDELRVLEIFRDGLSSVLHILLQVFNYS
jgi:rRNA-processing protein FCF1